MLFRNDGLNKMVVLAQTIKKCHNKPSEKTVNQIVEGVDKMKHSTSKRYLESVLITWLSIGNPDIAYKLCMKLAYEYALTLKMNTANEQSNFEQLERVVLSL